MGYFNWASAWQQYCMLSMMRVGVVWIVPLLPLCLLAQRATAQEPPASPHSSLTVVNAVPGKENVFVSFDGASIWAPGFTPGQSTGAVMFPSGSKQIKIECEGYATTEAKLDLPPGANCAIVMYPGDLVPDGPDKGKRRIGVFVPSPHLAGGKKLEATRWKAVLVGTDKPQEVEINGKKVALVPRKSSELASNAGSVSVRYQGTELLAVAVEEIGEYWVVVFPGDAGLEAVLLTHSPFKLPSS